jgi:hypothetical protein
LRKKKTKIHITYGICSLTSGNESATFSDEEQGSLYWMIENISKKRVHKSREKKINLYHFILKNRTLLRWVWTRIHCRAAQCGAARGPFDHFKIQQIWFRSVFTNSTNSRFRPQAAIDHTELIISWHHYLDYSIELWIGCKFLNLLLYKKCILVFLVLELNKMLYESIVQNDTSYHRVRHNFMWWTGRADDWHM